MDEVVLAPLVELIDPRRKITYGIVQPGPRQPEGEGVPLIRGQDYSSGTVRTRDLYWVLPEISARYKRSLVRPGDLLISIVGYVGAIAEVPAELDGANLTQTTARLSVGSNADSRFLLHALRGPEFQAEVRRYMKGSAQPGLNLADVERMQVRLPPLEAQRRIAEILDTIDETIQATERVIAKLDLVRLGLLNALLAPGISASPPEGWTALRIDDLLGKGNPPMRSGPFGSALLSSELVDEGIPLLGIDNVERERFIADFRRFVTEEKAAELARYRVFPDDLMITIMGTVGRCCTVPSTVRHAISSKHVWTITLDRAKYLPKLACLQMNYSPWVLEHFSRDEQGGIMSAIRSDTLRSLVLPTPPMAEQERIWAVLDESSRRLKAERSTLAKLRLARSGLAADLLSGQVRTVAP